MWQPQASIGVLQQRADIIKAIRSFFANKHVLEVDVPVLGEYGVTDPYIDALTASINDRPHYLQSSPEYFMKRLLAAGAGDMYYLGKAFRKDEVGRLHHHEFTMLEWYRLGFDDRQLVDEVIELIKHLDDNICVQRASYADVFYDQLGLDPHLCSDKELSLLAKQLLNINWDNEPRSTWLDLLFSHCIEPELKRGLYVIYDYPACQSALAKVADDEHGRTTAKRFEFFLNGVELANGYWELTDAEEQRLRFEDDNKKRNSLGKPQIAMDTNLLAAMESGLPECAGVALGVDRLVMGLLGLANISEQRSF